MNEEALSPTTRALLALVSHRSPGTPRMTPTRQDEDISSTVARPVATGAEGHGRAEGAVIEDPVVHYLNLVNHSRPSSGRGSGHSKAMQTAETQTGSVQPEDDNQIMQTSSRSTSVEPQGNSSSHVTSTDTRSPSTFQDLISCCDPNTPEVVYLNACPPSVAVAASSPQATPKEAGAAVSSSNSAVTEQPSSTTGSELMPLPNDGGTMQQDSSSNNDDLRTHTAGAQNVTTTYSIMISQQVSASTDGATRAMLDSFRTIQTIEQADSEPSPDRTEMDSSGHGSQSSYTLQSSSSSSSSVVAQINSPRTSQGFHPGSEICLKYPCETLGCNRAYLHKKDLIRHMRMMHNTAPQRMEATMVNVPPRPNVCGLSGCMKSYIHYKDLVRHQKQVHYVALGNLANVQKRYPCDYARCSKSYIHKKDLIRHKRLFHNDTSMHPTVPDAIIVDLDEVAAGESSPTGIDEFDLQMMESSNSEEPTQDESVGSPTDDLAGCSGQETFLAATPTHHPTHHPCCPHHQYSHCTDNPHPRGQASHSSGPHSNEHCRSTSWSDDTRSIGTSPVGAPPQIQACSEGDIPTSESLAAASVTGHQAGTSATLADVIENTINSTSPSATRGHQPTTALSPWSALLCSMDLPSPASTACTTAARTSYSSTQGNTSELAVATATQTRVSPSLQMADTQPHSQAVSQMSVDQCSAAVQAGGGVRSTLKSGTQHRHPRKQHTNVPLGMQTLPNESGRHNYKQQAHVSSGAQTSQTEILHGHYKQHAHASPWTPVQQAEASSQARETHSGMQVGRSMGISPHSTCCRRASSPSVLPHAESNSGHYHDGWPLSAKRRALCDASVQTEEYPHSSLSPYVNLMPAQPYHMSSSRRADEMTVIGGHSSRYDPSLFGSPGQEHGSFSPPSPRHSRSRPSYSSHHQPIGNPYSPRYDWSPELYESDDESCPPTPSPSLLTCACGRSVRPPPTHMYDHSPLHHHHGSAFSPVSHHPRHSYDRHGQPMGHSHQPHPPEHYHRQLSPRMSHSRQSFDSAPDMQLHGPLEPRWPSGKQRRSREVSYSSSTSHRVASYTGGSMEEQQPRAVRRGSTSPTWQTSTAMTSSALTSPSSSSHYRGNTPYLDRQEPHPVPASRAPTIPSHVPVTTSSHSVSLAASQSHTPSRTSSRQQSTRPKETERSISPLTLRLLALTRQTMHNDFSQRHHHPT